MVKESPLDPPPMSVNTRSQYVWVALAAQEHVWCWIHVTVLQTSWIHVTVPLKSGIHVTVLQDTRGGVYVPETGTTAAWISGPGDRGLRWPRAVLAVLVVWLMPLRRKFWDAWYEMQLGLCTLAGMLVFLGQVWREGCSL